MCKLYTRCKKNNELLLWNGISEQLLLLMIINKLNKLLIAHLTVAPPMPPRRSFRPHPLLLLHDTSWHFTRENTINYVRARTN